MKTMTIAAAIFFLALAPLAAQQPHFAGRFQVGVRSGMILDDMDLNHTDEAFGTLGFDGLKGPHTSSLYALYLLTPRLRVGMEVTAVSSTADRALTMNYHALGPVVELVSAGAVFYSAGVHVGGVVANAMRRANSDEGWGSGAVEGQFLNDSGVFVGPFVGAGVRVGRNEVRLFAKTQVLIGDESPTRLRGFNATFGGVSYAFAF